MFPSPRWSRREVIKKKKKNQPHTRTRMRIHGQSALPQLSQRLAARKLDRGLPGPHRKKKKFIWVCKKMDTNTYIR